jgi:hypothetical protein
MLKPTLALSAIAGLYPHASFGPIVAIRKAAAVRRAPYHVRQGPLRGSISAYLRFTGNMSE